MAIYKPSLEERKLRDLLALIHNDGGEHNNSVGLWQSVEDARRKIMKAKKEGILKD